MEGEIKYVSLVVILVIRVRGLLKEGKRKDGQCGKVGGNFYMVRREKL